METIEVLSVNRAAERGRKFAVDKLVFDMSGVAGDAHAGTERPVSLFNQAEAERFYEITGAKPLDFGQFAENITFRTKSELKCRIFDRFVKDDLILEAIQLGKPFHDRFREPGNYVMPREGIFCRVIKGGTLKAGDEMQFHPKIFKARIITLSDRASQGIYEDKSGPAANEELTRFFNKIDWQFAAENIIIPDDESALSALFDDSLKKNYDMIITTGGTGIGPRDITPDVMKHFIKKEIPGIMEMIRWKFGIEKPAALISRAIAGVHGKTLMFALPGSVRAVKEYLGEINKHLEHLFYMVEGVERH